MFRFSDFSFVFDLENRVDDLRFTILKSDSPSIRGLRTIHLLLPCTSICNTISDPKTKDYVYYYLCDHIDVTNDDELTPTSTFCDCGDALRGRFPDSIFVTFLRTHSEEEKNRYVHCDWFCKMFKDI